MKKVLAVLAAVVALLGASTGAAVAHVAIAPDNVPQDTFATFTFTVPNEEESEDTVGVDVSLPPDFILESAQSLPGWRTVVDTRADGTATAIHWSGGRLPPRTFGEFSMRGRVGDKPDTMSFSVVQRYQSSSVSWSGAAESDRPAPYVTVSGAGPTTSNTAGGQAEAAQVPQAPDPAPAATATEGQDDLARSRADLAVVLALLAILVPLGFVGISAVRRRTATRNG